MSATPDPVQSSPAPATASSSPLHRIDSVAGLAAVGVTILLCLMLARVAQLQLAPGSRLAAFMGDRVTTLAEPAPRGDIRDRRGRIIACTRFGKRVFVDPRSFPVPPGEAFQKLGDAIGMRADEVARVIAPKIAANQRAAELLADADPSNDADARICKYVSLGKVLEDGRESLVEGLKIPGVHLETRSVRQTPAGDLVAALLGRVGIDHDGLMGAELLYDKAVAAVQGRMSYVRDASGKPLWVHPGSYSAPERGRDIRLSVDLEFQRLVVDELTKGVEEADAAGGRAIVLDPRTGEILAMADVLREVKTVEYPWTYPIGQEPSGKRPRYKTIRDDPSSAVVLRNRCVEDAYEPGSTFKPFMWAETTALGLAKPTERFHTGKDWRTPYGRSISDVHDHDSQTWSEVLINSSNIGMAMATMRLSYKQMRDAVVRLGFGSRTNIGLPGESAGLVTPLKRWGPYSQSSVAMGHEVAVTPLQMVRAFTAFARTGEDAGTIPELRLTTGDGEMTVIPGRRVLPANVAELARNTMRGVTKNLDSRMSTWDTEKVPLRYDAFGKSGTAEIPLGPPPPGKKRPKGSDGYYQGQYNASFIAGAPVDNPRIVVLVVIDDPGPQRVATRRHYGARAAGPVVRRVIERGLAYMGVPPVYPDSHDPDLAGRRQTASVADR